MRSHTQRLMVCAASFAALCMGLAGCGSNTASTGGDSGEVVNLTYMHRLPDSEGMTLVKDIVAKWNKDHPSIQVKATKFDGAAQDMIKKLETDVKAGNAPDLAQVGYAEVPEVFTKGLLEDVTEEAAKYKSDFAEGPYSMMQVDGKTYGLPQDTGPLVYFYNQKAFDELGIKVPKTKDELIEAAKTAAASGKYIMDYEADEAGNIFAGLANASDPWYTVKNDAWVVNTNGSGSQAFAETFQELIDNKATLTNPRWVPSFDASLQDGTLIGNIGAAWEAPLFKDSAGDTGKGDWRVTQIGDWFGNGTSTGPDGGSGVAVLKGCEHVEQLPAAVDDGFLRHPQAGHARPVWHGIARNLQRSRIADDGRTARRTAGDRALPRSAALLAGRSCGRRGQGLTGIHPTPCVACKRHAWSWINRTTVIRAPLFQAGTCNERKTAP